MEEPMALTVREIDHVVLRTADMARALRFYAQVLGCREERRLDELGLVQLRAGRSMIDLIDIAVQAKTGDGSAPEAGRRNMDHFCVRIEPWDEDEIRALLSAHGIDPGETVTRYGAEGDGPSIYFNDPDGNMVELKGPPAPAPLAPAKG